MTWLDVFLWIWYFTYVNQWYRAEPCRWNVNSLPRLNPPWEPNGIAIVLLLWNFIVDISFHNTWCIFQHLPYAYFSIYIRLCIFQHSIQKKTTNICLALCTGTPHDHSMRVLPWEITLCDNDHYWLLMFRLEQVSCRITPDGPEYSSTWDMRNLWRKPPVIGPDLWNLAPKTCFFFAWKIATNDCKGQWFGCLDGDW